MGISLSYFRIIYDKTSRDIIYVGGDKGLFVRWYLIRETVNKFQEEFFIFSCVHRMDMI
jgi:hypothetical protein